MNVKHNLQVKNIEHHLSISCRNNSPGSIYFWLTVSNFYFTGLEILQEMIISVWGFTQVGYDFYYTKCKDNAKKIFFFPPFIEYIIRQLLS